MTGINATTYIQMMPHTTAVNTALHFGLKGRIIPTSSACTSGSQAIGYAYEAIRYGKQKVMVAGGAEELSAASAAVFDLLFATSTKNDSPTLMQDGPMPNIQEVAVDGVSLEMGIKPVSNYATPEIILSNPELAFHFTVDSSLYDPEGWLGGLCREVIPRYADREWVDRRLDHECLGYVRSVGLRPMANQLLGPSGELSVLGDCTTFLAGAPTIAALRPPKIGSRLFVTIRDYLAEIDRLDLHERLLGIFGFDRISTPEAQEMLVETARFFDLVLERKH